MVLTFPDLLQTQELQQIQTLLRDTHHAPWESGAHSAGVQARQVKHNEQLPHDCEQAQAVRLVVLRALERSHAFFAAALPKKIFPPRVNRYEASALGGPHHYGPHVDNSLRRLGPQTHLRTDWSCTVFLNAPQDYEGGELCIHDGPQSLSPTGIKLPAGAAVLYPSGRLHEVKPVTQGTRLACFFWVESLVAGEAERRVLYGLDQSLMALRQQLGETPETVALTGTYHQLLRLWASP